MNAQNHFDMTALMFAAENSHHQCVERLVETGANINLDNNSNGTALFYVAVSRSMRNLEILTSAGVGVNVIEWHRKSAVTAAAGKGHTDLIVALIEAGADVNVQGDEKMFNNPTALMDAMKISSADCVKTLIEAGANINAKDRLGRTALHHAGMDSRNEEHIELLLKEGGTNKRG